jgi:dihydroxy-acid dehydratase
MKPSAAEPRLLRHSGPALVFDNYAALKASIDRDDLDVTLDHVLVLRNAGPLGAGMPEWGALPIPRKLLQQGVRDMVRISDARMSGTAYGTIVLHVAPEAAIGGPLALVETGDFITLDLPSRTLQLEVGEQDLRRRRDRWRPAPGVVADRGYAQLFREHVLQADRGVDFDFLVGGSGHAVPPESH